MSGIEIRDLLTEEAGIAARFFHEQWRPNHIFYRNRDLLLWQYHDNPYAAQFTSGLSFRSAFEGSRLIGVFGYIPFVFNRYGQRQFGCNLSAWWVCPEHRRGGLALRMLHSLQVNSPFDACIAGINTPVAEKLYERMSWVVLRTIPRLAMILDVKRFEELLPAGRTLPDTADSALTHAKRRSFKRAKVSRLDSFRELAAIGWDKFYWHEFAPNLMGPARESAYLSWRYGEIPLFKYAALVAECEGHIQGLLVYRVEQIKDSEQRIVRLVDLVAVPAAIPALLDTLIQYASEEESTCIDFFCTCPTYLREIKAHGFIDLVDESGERYWFPHLFQPLDHERQRLNSAWWIRGMDLSSTAAREEFCIMKGDYEFDRPN